MTRNQEAYFGMALKTKNFIIKNTLVLNAIPGVLTTATELNILIESLLLADMGSRSNITGYAIEKKNKRKELEAFCIKFSTAIAAFATNSNNTELHKRASVPLSKWYSCSQNVLISLASAIHNLATPVLSDLAPYGIASTDQLAFDTSLNSFIDKLANPSIAISNRKDDNDNIPEIIKSIRTLLTEKLDVLMRVLNSTNPSMHNLYLSARAIDKNR